jgi:hypothetical protein
MVSVFAPVPMARLVVTQTVFDLVAYAAPQEKKPGAPAPAAKPK